MDRNERADFAAAVRAMAQHIWNTEGYLSQDKAAPFVAGLPEFWREPARVMANCGYYSSADEWMKLHAEWTLS